MSFISKLYELAPVSIQNFAISLYGYKVKINRFGSEYDYYIDYLNTMDRAANEFLLKYQYILLNEMINYAFQYVPYYRDEIVANPCSKLEDSDLEALRKLPIITKDFILKNQKNFISEEYSERQLQKIKTSGTTGTPFTIYSTRDAIQRNYAFYSRFLTWHGVDINDRQATFAGRVIVPGGQSEAPYWRYNRARNQMLFSSYHLSKATIPAYIQELEKFRPVFIDSFPSPIYLISKYINLHGIKHSIRPKVIVTSSEVLTKSYRETIEKAFDCPVADQYGAAEMAGFIGQCEHGSYHVAMEYGIVEILDSSGMPVLPGEKGQLVCTGFLNRAMPLIRYQTGDSVILSNSKCSCGRETIIVKEIIGREDDVLITKEGRLVSNMGIIFKSIEAILEGQIIQEDLDNITISIISDRELMAQEVVKLRSDLELRIGPVAHVNIKYPKQLKRTKGGKLKRVITRVNQEFIDQQL